MTTRPRQLSKPDAQGQYVRQIGWKLNSRDTRVQHKFRLGTDKREAERRDQRLRLFWDSLAVYCPPEKVLWDEQTLDVARQIANGVDRIAILPVADDEPPDDYWKRVLLMQLKFPFLRAIPADLDRFELSQHYRAGREDELGVRNILSDMSANPDKYFGEQERDFWRAPAQQSASEQNDAGSAPAPSVPFWLRRNAKPEEHNEASESMPLDGSSFDQRFANNAPSLHQAFDAYVAWIGEDYLDVAANDVTDYGRTKTRQIKTLKSRHDDVPLASIDHDTIEKMYRYWRQRPFKQSPNGVQERMSHASLRNYIGELHRFFKWLHRSRQFSWRKPEDFDSIDRRIPRDTESVKRRMRNVDTFQIEELQLLNRFASPMERLYFLLGLNCGFGAKEIATLTIGEVYLHQALPAREQELFDFPSTVADSFVSLVRNKTTVPGKFILFSQTVQMLEWIMGRRHRQSNPAPDQPLILNSNGRPLDYRTESGNASQQIPNSFGRLKKRIQTSGASINNLPFKFLRKTAGDLIRRHADGEISGVFLLHGQPVESDNLSDAYTNRPFGKVFTAIRAVEETLQPVFAEVTGDPTREQGTKSRGNAESMTIAELHQQGLSLRRIAQATGQSRMAVQRQIKKLSESASRR